MADRHYCLTPGPRDSVCLLIPLHWGLCVFTPWEDTPMAKRGREIIGKFEAAAERARVRQEEEERIQRAKTDLCLRLATSINVLIQGKRSRMPRRIK